MNSVGRSLALALFDQAAIVKTSNSLWMKRSSSFTCGLQLRQGSRRIMHMTFEALDGSDRRLDPRKAPVSGG